MPGLTPFPPYHDRPLPDKFGDGMSWLYRHPCVGTAEHTMVGTLGSADSWFRVNGSQAATDWGIGGVLDGDSHDGVIFRWIDVDARPYCSPWASGWDAGGPGIEGDGQAFLDRFGVAALNAQLRSIEHSGMVTTPMTVKQWRSSMWLTAAIHHQDAKQGYEEFAWNMHHREFAKKDCPFPRFYRHTPQYQEGVRRIMEHYETGRDVSDVLEIAGLSVPLPLGEGAGPIEKPLPPIFVRFAKEIRFTTRQGSESHRWAFEASKVVREYRAGQVLRTIGYYVGEKRNGRDEWLVIRSPGASDKARIHILDLKEEIPAQYRKN